MTSTVPQTTFTPICKLGETLGIIDSLEYINVYSLNDGQWYSWVAGFTKDGELLYEELYPKPGSYGPAEIHITCWTNIPPVTTTTAEVTTTTVAPVTVLPMTGVPLGVFAAVAGGLILLGGAALIGSRRHP